MSNESFIIGIDPGLTKTGWGVVKKSGDDIKYIECGVIKTESSDSMENRLTFIYNSVLNLISRFNPLGVAMEQVFVNLNPGSSQKLIMARTASFLAIAKSGYVVKEYTPNEIKKNITGLGHSSKDQIYVMVQKILNSDIRKDNISVTLDSIDALAVAVCHAFSL
ncbi:MAG: crossover junction endodeoxyribonuclease RuvC [Holosporales bacterium]|jgi:crossover junction endodeoxyribonuclease RuvC|nr:crossover junction endodeoxyribonuclease RuvC [Holosporales bacterium]